MLAACLGTPSLIFSSGCVCFLACSGPTFIPDPPGIPCSDGVEITLIDKLTQQTGIKSNFKLTISSDDQSKTVSCPDSNHSADDIVPKCNSLTNSELTSSVFIANFQADQAKIIIERENKPKQFLNVLLEYGLLRNDYTKNPQKYTVCSIAKLTLDVD